MAIGVTVNNRGADKNNNKQAPSKEESSKFLDGIMRAKESDKLVAALNCIDKAKIPQGEIDKYSEVIAQDFRDGYHRSKNYEKEWKETHEFLYEYNQRMKQYTDIKKYVETFRIGMAAVYEYYKTVPMIAPDPFKTTKRWVKGDPLIDGPWRPKYIGRNESKLRFKDVLPYILDCEMDLDELAQTMNPSLYEKDDHDDPIYQYIDNGEEIPDSYYRENFMPEQAEKIIQFRRYERANPDERKVMDRIAVLKAEQARGDIDEDSAFLMNIMKGKDRNIDQDQLVDDIGKKRPKLAKFIRRGTKRYKGSSDEYRNEIRRVMSELRNGVGVSHTRYNEFAGMSNSELYNYAQRIIQLNKENPRPEFNGDLFGKGYDEWDEEMTAYEDSISLHKIGNSHGMNKARYVDSLEANHDKAMKFYETWGWNVRDWYSGKDKMNNVGSDKKKAWKDERTWKSCIVSAQARVMKERRELYSTKWYGKLSEEDFNRVTTFYNNVDKMLVEYMEKKKPKKEDYEKVRQLREVPTVEMIITGEDREKTMDYARKIAQARRKPKKNEIQGFVDDKSQKKKWKKARKKKIEDIADMIERENRDETISTAEVYCKPDGSIGFISSKEGKQLLHDYDEGSATFGVVPDDVDLGRSMLHEDMDEYSRILSESAYDRMSDGDSFDFDDEEDDY